MTELGAVLFGLLEHDDRYAVAVLEGENERKELLDSLEILADQKWHINLVSNVSDALEQKHKGTVVVLIPTDEVAAMCELERKRDQLLNLDRFILVLSEDGERSLAKAPALASFLRGTRFRVREEIDVTNAREDFVKLHGQTPEKWLNLWRMGAINDSTENNLVLGLATWLQGGDE